MRLPGGSLKDDNRTRGVGRLAVNAATSNREGVGIAVNAVRYSCVTAVGVKHSVIVRDFLKDLLEAGWELLGAPALVARFRIDCSRMGKITATDL